MLFPHIWWIPHSLFSAVYRESSVWKFFDKNIVFIFFENFIVLFDIHVIYTLIFFQVNSFLFWKFKKYMNIKKIWKNRGFLKRRPIPIILVMFRIHCHVYVHIQKNYFNYIGWKLLSFFVHENQNVISRSHSASTPGTPTVSSAVSACRPRRPGASNSLG